MGEFHTDKPEFIRQYTYAATEAELRDLSDKIRYGAARSLRIDAERLDVQVKVVSGYEYAGESPYVTAVRASLKLDGVTPVDDGGVIRHDLFHAVVAMMRTLKVQPDPSRLTLYWTNPSSA